MEPNSDIDVSFVWIFIIHQDFAGFIHQINGKQGSLFHMGAFLRMVQVTDTHVRVTNSLRTEMKIQAWCEYDTT